ncbi:hypothetical protein [Streptomyces sp. NPDC052610]|uniref:hypothetical protein n=1 Tax=Streptomyces sp. NPDC052610 TaxID=3154952 RepID=UPI00342C82BE
MALPLAVAYGGSVGSRGATSTAEPGTGWPLGAGPAAGPESAREGAWEASDAEGAGHAGEDGGAGDDRAPSDRGGAGPDARRSPFLLGLGLSTAARCGPELTSPDGIEAQTCVLTQNEENWARTYYRNATGRSLDAVLTLMEPGGRTVRIRCAVGAEDEPASCETPREGGRGPVSGYTAVAEFAERGGRGPLLLRVGSNSGPLDGS